ncbi:MAG: phosphotransferase [Atopobiaceae bacterium]|nr:phosphotransferase [Atopobiaceae bacterium]MBR1830168.1 phosphotransferase [Atopobiaceae bacterium]
MSDRFARGRSAEVFRTDDGKVMKLFFADYPRAYAESEYKNTKIASDLGCTPIKVYDMVEQDGRCGFVMDYVDGVSQNDMPGKNPLYLLKGGKDLAQCHVIVQSKRSHELEDIRSRCVGLLEDDTMDFLSDDEKERAKAFLLSLPDEDEILHLDFHTGNVLVDKQGNCSVIDWMTAARGNRAVEVAMMEFLFSEAELFPEASQLQRMLFSAVRGFIGDQFFKEYQRMTPIAAVEVDRYRLLALMVRRSWGIEFERPYLTRTIRTLITEYCS